MNRTLRPQHKVCEKNVAVPTILVEPFRPDGEDQVFVQWFGEADGVGLGDMQFRFPTPLSRRSHPKMGDFTEYRVILLGQVKDWPNPDAAQQIADQSFSGDLNGRILWLTSFVYRSQDGEDPACLAVPMPVLLADGNCGIITPRLYCDLEVLERTKKEVAHDLFCYASRALARAFDDEMFG